MSIDNLTAQFKRRLDMILSGNYLVEIDDHHQSGESRNLIIRNCTTRDHIRRLRRPATSIQDGKRYAVAVALTSLT